MLSRYLIPIAPLLLVALSTVCAGAFFLYLESETRRLKSGFRRRQSAQETTIRDLQRQLIDVAERLSDTEERAGVLTPPMPVSGLNLNKRSQAIRMSRRGEAPQQIAASLHLPQREVELLLKVYGLALNGSREPNS